VGNPGPGTRRRRRVLWLVWWLDFSFVVAGSLLPGALLGRMHLNSAHLSDKWIHFCGYALLAALPVSAAAGRLRVLVGIVCLAVLGLVLEFAQRLVPGRTYDSGDFVANVLGLLTGVAAGLLARKLP